jgi:hypothetical protein
MHNQVVSDKVNKSRGINIQLKKEHLFGIGEIGYKGIVERHYLYPIPLYLFLNKTIVIKGKVLLNDLHFLN